VLLLEFVDNAAAFLMMSEPHLNCCTAALSWTRAACCWF